MKKFRIVRFGFIYNCASDCYRTGWGVQRALQFDFFLTRLRWMFKHLWLLYNIFQVEDPVTHLLQMHSEECSPSSCLCTIHTKSASAKATTDLTDFRCWRTRKHSHQSPPFDQFQYWRHLGRKPHLCQHNSLHATYKSGRSSRHSWFLHRSSVRHISQRSSNSLPKHQIHSVLVDACVVWAHNRTDTSSSFSALLLLHFSYGLLSMVWGDLA